MRLNITEYLIYTIMISLVVFFIIGFYRAMRKNKKVQMSLHTVSILISSYVLGIYALSIGVAAETPTSLMIITLVFLYIESTKENKKDLKQIKELEKEITHSRSKIQSLNLKVKDLVNRIE